MSIFIELLRRIDDAAKRNITLSCLLVTEDEFCRLRNNFDYLVYYPKILNSETRFCGIPLEVIRNNSIPLKSTVIVDSTT